MSKETLRMYYRPTIKPRKAKGDPQGLGLAQGDPYVGVPRRGAPWGGRGYFF